MADSWAPRVSSTYTRRVYVERRLYDAHIRNVRVEIVLARPPTPEELRDLCVLLYVGTYGIVLLRAESYGSVNGVRVTVPCLAGALPLHMLPHTPVYVHVRTALATAFCGLTLLYEGDNKAGVPAIDPQQHTYTLVTEDGIKHTLVVDEGNVSIVSFVE